MNIVVILGHRLQDDGHMSKILVKRLEVGLKTWKEVDADLLCVTGGMPNKLAKFTEASKMSRWLLNHDFPKDKLVIEDGSNTTVENAENLAKVLRGKEIETIYLVSSKYHFTRLFAPRAQNCFKRAFKNSNIIKVFE